MNKNKGFIALIFVLAVSAVALLVSAGILLQSITQSVISSSEEMAQKAWASVNGCAEKAVWNISTTTGTAQGWSGDYTTDGHPFTIGGSDCYVYPATSTSTPVADSRLINASSTVSEFTRKIQVIIASSTSTSTPPSIYSWQEVGDF